MTKILALDVGGTKISYAIVDDKGEITGKVNKIFTPKNSKEIEKVFKNIIEKYEKDIDIIAFATAGAVNIENTRVESSTPNMPDGYKDIDFSLLSKKPVFVENDANAASWSEYKIGASKGEHNNITITLGTGIGGGFIIGGKLLRGYSGKGGEVGSMKIIGRGRTCTCGRLDCFESYASGTGLKLTAEEIAKENEIFKTSIYKDKKPNDITTHDIINGLKKGDSYCNIVFDTWEQDLITGLINIVNIFEPECIVLSGGMGEFTNVEKIQKAVNSEIVVFPVKIKLAKAGNYSGLIGTALLASEKFKV